MRRRKGRGYCYHLICQIYPADAEGDEGALDEGEDPHKNYLQGCCQQYVGRSKGLRQYEGTKLMITNLLFYINLSMMMVFGLNNIKFQDFKITQFSKFQPYFI